MVEHLGNLPPEDPKLGLGGTWDGVRWTYERIPTRFTERKHTVLNLGDFKFFLKLVLTKPKFSVAQFGVPKNQEIVV